MRNFSGVKKLVDTLNRLDRGELPLGKKLTWVKRV